MWNGECGKVDPPSPRLRRDQPSREATALGAGGGRPHRGAARRGRGSRRSANSKDEAAFEFRYSAPLLQSSSGRARSVQGRVSNVRREDGERGEEYFL